MHPPEYAFGARMVAPGRTRFRLWAPSRSEVSVEIAGMAPQPMTAIGDGWFETVADCGAGARYHFRIDPELTVPDPAAHAQAGDVHDDSVVVDHQAYRWKHSQWQGRPWHETVLYELHVGACGGFAGTMARLPALAALGFTAIELMPVADFPGTRNWGYDGVLPYAPDAAYGTPDELKALIDTAHGLGLMVFLDVVYNHFGPDGNYLSAYAGPFFRDDLHTPWGVAIDFRLPQVRDFYTQNMQYWLHEYRFDGLRLDAVHAISEPDWLSEAAHAVRVSMPAGRHVHLVLENDHNNAALLTGPANGLYDAQWNDDGHHALHVLLTGESEGYYGAYQDQPAQLLARCLAEGFIYQGQAAMHPGAPLRGAPSGHLQTTAFVMFLQNHDQIGNRALGERLTLLAQPQALRMAQALLLLAPSIPLMFMGEEVGATEPFLYFTSHAGTALADAVREGRRLEFAKFKAFSDPATRAHIPDPNAVETFSRSVTAAPDGKAAAGAPDAAHATTPHWQSATWEHWISTLLRLRHRYVVPGLVGARSLGAEAIGPAAVLARWRMGNNSILTLALNLADVAVPLAPGSVAADSAAALFDPLQAQAAVAAGSLPAYCLIALMAPPTGATP